MFNLENLSAQPMKNIHKNSNVNSSQPYSMQAILNKNEDNSILDLSTKEKHTISVSDKKISKGKVILNELQETEESKHVLMNIIQQKDMLLSETNSKINFFSGDYLQSIRPNFDAIQKILNSTNFIGPLSNISDSGSDILNQFQRFIFHKIPNNPLLNPNQFSHYSNQKNVFPLSNNDSISNYMKNASQFFHSPLNCHHLPETAAHMPLLAENFSKHYSNPTIDINSHFSLQNILKSTSSRKRKRTKVTDTRLPRRNWNQGVGKFSQIHENSFVEDTKFSNYFNPPSNSSQTSNSDITPGDPKRYTLTPIHLRKAKLMFLYTRYPNSQMLKTYFPDITFYKHNTAQLVKWFSNFREFYYSEMEKAVQRALSNGIQYAKDIDVTFDSELFKNLMTHFNKKKQIAVPCEFLSTVQITLREFFDAILAGKNLHQSWKKPIYKTIAKLDQILPEFFKDMNWMMELAKDENDNINN